MELTFSHRHLFLQHFVVHFPLLVVFIGSNIYIYIYIKSIICLLPDNSCCIFKRQHLPAVSSSPLWHRYWFLPQTFISDIKISKSFSVSVLEIISKFDVHFAVVFAMDDSEEDDVIITTEEDDVIVTTPVTAPTPTPLPVVISKPIPKTVCFHIYSNLTPAIEDAKQHLEETIAR